MDTDSHYDIFLSYSRLDKRRARLICEVLGSQGWSVFMDKEIQNGARWDAYLREKLELVSCVLVLWSSNAIASEWVLLEARRAKELEKLVHVTLDTTKPPEEFLPLQYNTLSEWSTTGLNEEFLSVLKSIAQYIGNKSALGILREPKEYEKITDDYLALTSSSWKPKKEEENRQYPYKIHLRLVGTEVAMRRVENVIYFFDPAYANNKPENVDAVLKAYVIVSANWRNGFGIYELANGYSVVRASVKVKNQGLIVNLSRMVDIMDEGPWLNNIYPTWTKNK